MLNTTYHHDPVLCVYTLNATSLFLRCSNSCRSSLREFFININLITGVTDLPIWALEMSVCSHRNIPILTLKMFLFGNAFRLTFQFRKKVKNPKCHDGYLVGMHLTICIWTLERSVWSHRNIRISIFKTFVFVNALRLTFQFRKIKKNPKTHHDYLVGMQLTICIWTMQRSVGVHQNIRNLAFKMFLYGNAFRLTFQFRKIVA